MSRRVMDQAVYERRMRMLACIIKYREENGFSPSVRELQEEVGLGSAASANRDLNILKEMGLIEKEPRRPRTVRVRREVFDAAKKDPAAFFAKTSPGSGKKGGRT